MDAKTLIHERVAGHIPISFIVNGERKELYTSPTARLVDMLRNNLQLTGTKRSCDIGRCGACSVIMNGSLVNACLVMAYQVDHASITTIEGDELSLIQEAFLKESGFQCGYCTPGMIVAVKALLGVTSSPSEEQIREALSGNVCRCTGYGSIIRAVHRAAKFVIEKSSEGQLDEREG